jgi:hypothetical protein
MLEGGRGRKVSSKFGFEVDPALLIHIFIASLLFDFIANTKFGEM